MVGCGTSFADTGRDYPVPPISEKERKAQILCVVSCILIALVLAVCIDLTISFVDAVQNQRLHCEVIF